MTMKLKTLFALSGMCLAGLVQAAEIRIAHVYDKTGSLEAYAKMSQTGLMLGLDYATGGTMMVNGKKLVVIEKDSQGKPDIGKSLLASAYQDDKADIAIGPTSSNVALAMLPVAEEYKKILVVDPAVSDAITGERWNRYIFRTARNSTMDALASAAVVDKPGTVVVTLAQDYAFGRDGVKAFKNALKQAKVAHEEYLPLNTTDFTAGTQRIVEAMKDKPGRKMIWILWAGSSNAFRVADELKRYNIELVTGANTLAGMANFKQYAGSEGMAYYYYGLPKNPVNNWLIAEHYRRHKSPPDLFTIGGMTAAIAVVEALKKTKGDVNSEKLITAMEGMSFETAKGKMIFRKEDHQALQSMYHIKFTDDPALPWAVPVLIREIGISELDVPIRNKR
jgi:branched-chain amino acid transport system substrate-binding protein